MIVRMARARFGEVWTLDGAPEGASFAIVSDDDWNNDYPTVFVIELRRVTHVQESAGTCMVDDDSGTVALVEALATAHEAMLVEHIATLTKTEMDCIADAMREIPLDYCVKGAARPAVAAA
jgi:mRNA-degrading endonuclease toxin of MazEF toxin-antitoxin module